MLLASIRQHRSALVRPCHEWTKLHALLFLHPTSVPNHWHAFLGVGGVAFDFAFASSVPCCIPFKEGLGVVVVAPVPAEVAVVVDPGFLEPPPNCSNSAKRCCKNLITFVWLGLESICSSVFAKATRNLKSAYWSAVFFTLLEATGPAATRPARLYSGPPLVEEDDTTA